MKNLDPAYLRSEGQKCYQNHEFSSTHVDDEIDLLVGSYFDVDSHGAPPLRDLRYFLEGMKTEASQDHQDGIAEYLTRSLTNLKKYRKNILTEL